MRPTELTETQIHDLGGDFATHETFARECLRIRDLTGSSIPMELGAGQRKLVAAIEKQRNRGKPVRLVVLKTRRSWFTAGACSTMFREVAFLPGRKGLIIADKYNPAGLEAFDYLVQYQRGYRPFSRHGASISLPKLVKDSEQRIEWEGDSFIDVLSAEGGDVGRGGGRHFVLADEVAFWRAPEETLTAVLNMVPYLPQTQVIIQSTANGVGGEFYELWQRAVDPSNISGWEPLFFGWLEHAPYRLPVEDKAKLQASLDREERILMEMHGASLEQLAWRRKTIATECRGKVDLFHQEYPTDAQEAFLASGRPALTISALTRMPVWKTPMVGEIEEVEEYPRRRLQFIQRDHGALTIGAPPDPARDYVIGADPSKGKDVSESQRGTDPDWSVAIPFDLITGVQVAQLRERLRPAQFAEYLAILGRFYNWAYLVPESNDAGFIDALLRTNYPLERIYQRRRDPTDRRSALPQEMGFETTNVTRPWLVSALDDALREGSIKIHSAVAQQECRTFVIKPDGKAEHQTGCHDDCVIALALGVIGMRYAPRKRRTLVDGGQRPVMQAYGQRKRSDDDD